MEIELTKYKVDESQYTKIGELKDIPLQSTIKENIYTKRLAIFNRVPFVPHKILKLGKMAHFGFLPIIGCVYATDEKDFQIVELATRKTLKDVLDALKCSKQPTNPTALNYQNIIFGICSAMKYAEEKGFKHGNLTPSNIYLSDDYNPHIHGVGIADIWDFNETRSDVTNFGVIISTLFAGNAEHFKFELDIADDIRKGKIKTFSEIYEKLVQNYSGKQNKYIRRIIDFDSSREQSSTNVQREIDYGKYLNEIGSAPAAELGNSLLLKNGREPFQVPFINAVMPPEIQLQKIQPKEQYKMLYELSVPYGTAYVKEGPSGKVLCIPVPFNTITRKVIQLLHPVLSMPIAFELANDVHGCQLILEYGEKLDHEHVDEALVAVAALLAYCHKNGIHHGCLSEEFITIQNKFAKLAFVGIAEIRGNKVTDLDDIKQFGKLAKKLLPNADERMASIFDLCEKGKITMEEAYNELACCQTFDDYCITLNQFENFRKQAYIGDVEAYDGLGKHFDVMSRSPLPQIYMKQYKEIIYDEFYDKLDTIPHKLTSKDIKKRYSAGMTLLHKAAMVNNIKLVKKLIKLGANPNAVTNDGQTALHLAAKRKHQETYNYLSSITKDIADKYGKKANEYASKEMNWISQSNRHKFIFSSIRGLINLI